MSQPKDFFETDPNYKPRYRGGISISGNGRNGNGGSSFWLYLLQGLVLAGVLGLVAMTLSLRDNMTEVKTTVTRKVEQYDREFDRVYKAIDGNSERITSLEQQRWKSDSDPVGRQKR